MPGVCCVHLSVQTSTQLYYVLRSYDIIVQLLWHRSDYLFFQTSVGKALWNSIWQGIHSSSAAIKTTSLIATKFGKREYFTLSFALPSSPPTTKRALNLFTFPVLSLFLSKMNFVSNICVLKRGTSSQQCVSQIVCNSKFISSSRLQMFLLDIVYVFEGSSSL